MVAAEALGIDLPDVRVVVGDTDMAAHSDASAGDRITYVTSKAVLMAAEDLIGHLKKRVAEEFDLRPADVQYADKRFWVEGAPEMQVTLADLALRSVRGEGGAVMGYGSVSETFSDNAIAPNAAAHVVDVEVDPETGKVDVLRYTTFQDIGTAVNPIQVEGQMQGGAAQGIGWALTEECQFDDDGVLTNPTLLDYRLQTAADLPFIDANIIEVPSPDHPLGIRAVGQVPIVPPAAAIANAIQRATGVRLNRLPMNPERVYWALAEAKQSSE
jgi:CO/xanthine dehydrogenase Mo-binding subunit